MKTTEYKMLNAEFYEAIVKSFLENPWWKALAASLFSLFTVPLEFVLAIPIFWMMDFMAGVYASRKEGISWDWDKLNSQFVKICLHMTFLVGCTIIANLFEVPQMIYFGFGYIIANEFLFSTIPHLFGDKRAGQIVSHIKGILFKAIGFEFKDPADHEEDPADT